MLPILFEAFGLKIFSYPLMIGLCTGLGLTLLNSLRETNKITTKYYYSFLGGVLFFAWFGAKVFFLCFSKIENSSKYLLNSNFWMGGGFVFYGGLIFATLYALFFIFVLKKFKWEEGKYLLPVLTISHGVGRFGCVLAGCCFGSQTDFILSINHRHPVQLYEGIILIIFGIYFFKTIDKLDTLKSLILYLIFYSILRFNMEFLRDDLIRGTLFGLSTSQTISTLLFLLGIILYIYQSLYLKRKSLS